MRGLSLLLFAALTGSSAIVVAQDEGHTEPEHTEPDEPEVETETEPPVTETTEAEADDQRVPPEPPQEQGEAWLRFNAGERAFSSGRYEEALRDFRRAYELSARAEILLRVADSADRLRDDRAAYQALSLYLEQTAQDDPRRPEVEARAEVLRDVVGDLPDDGASEPSEEVEEPGPLSGRLFTWVAAALTLVAAGISVGNWIGANDAFDELFAACTEAGGCTDDRVERSSVNTRVMLTNVFLGVSLGLAAVTAGLYFLEAPDSPDEVSVAVGPGGVIVEGTF